MAKVTDQERLRHMLEATEKAIRYSQGKSRQDLDQDEILCLALVQLVQIIGEAASRIDPAFRPAYPGIPWGPIIGMRNRLVHTYDQINLDILFQVLSQDLGPLVTALKQAVGQP